MKQSNQHSKANPRSEQTDPESVAIPTGFSRARSGFREIGGQVTGFYRYLPGNRAEIMARFQHREQIARLCQRLQLRLEAEFDLAALKNSERRKRARRVGSEEPMASGSPGRDAGQLDLLEVPGEYGTLAAEQDLAAFSGDPKNADPADAVTPAASANSSASHRSEKTTAEPAAKSPEKTTKQATAKATPGTATKTPVQNAGPTPRTLEESLSEIRPLGPKSLNDRDGAQRPASKKRGASA